ncbi:MAG TPA: c-type cytochrome [Bryobacteraceae bacterium]
MRSLFLAAVLALQLASQTPDAKQSRVERGRQFLGLPPPPDPAAVERGAKVYAQNCAFCHGPKATGAEGPNLIRSTVVLHDEKGELIGPVVQNGRPDKGMPAFSGMTPAQVFDIAEFLHARVQEAANRSGYKILNVVTGDPKAGEAFFNAHCTSCHSAGGDLAGIASKYEPADLQAHFLYPDKAAPPVTITVTLQDGQVVSGTLKRQDDFNISMVDNSGTFHSWPVNSVKFEVKDPLEGHRKLLALYADSDMHNVLAYLVTLKSEPRPSGSVSK